MFVVVSSDHAVVEGPLGWEFFLLFITAETCLERTRGQMTRTRAYHGNRKKDTGESPCRWNECVTLKRIFHDLDF